MSISGRLHDLLLSALGSPEARNEIEDIINEELTSTPDNTASAVVQRDASGNFAAGTITATLTGTASVGTVSTTAATTTRSNSATYYPTFVAANSTSSQGVSVGPMTYNPSTGALTTTSFAGSLTGNADTATSATTSTTTSGLFNIAGANAEAITSTGAVSVTKLLTNLTVNTYAVTLAAPAGAGQIKIIQATAFTGGTVTLALTEIVGARAAAGTIAATTCTFTNVTDSLILLSVAGKWVYLGGSAVCT